jgi:hypothetical protein
MARFKPTLMHERIKRRRLYNAARDLSKLVAYFVAFSLTYYYIFCPVVDIVFELEGQ